MISRDLHDNLSTNTSVAGVPRRFAIGSLVVIVTVFAVLFRILTLFDTPAEVAGLIALFFSGIGLGQAFLLRGQRPRAASCLGGALLAPAIMLAVFGGSFVVPGLAHLRPNTLDSVVLLRLMSGMFYLSLFGSVLGYFFGCIAAGAFLVTDRWRPLGAPALQPSSTGSNERHELGTPLRLDERLWNGVSHLSRELSLQRRQSSLRLARNMFCVTFVLLAGITPFVRPTWQRWYFVGAAIVSVLVAYAWAGLVQWTWKRAIGVIVLSLACAASCAVYAQRIFIFTEPTPPQMAYPISLLFGVVAGFLSVGTVGWWVSWRGGFTGSLTRTTTRMGRAAILILALVYVCVLGATYWMLNRPKQVALNYVHTNGGYAYGGVWGSVVGVFFHTPQVGDEVFDLLAPFTGLNQLAVVGTQISDSGLAKISQFPWINTLDLSNTSITDAGAENLLQLKSLVQLFLSGTQVSDDAIAQFTSLGLRRLDVSNTRITGTGFASWKANTSLFGLYLSNCPVHSTHVAHLRQLQVLRELSLNGTMVDDDACKHLASMPTLTSLGLANTQVSDVGLLRLVKLIRLTSLDVQGTNVTPEGVMRFRQLLPTCDLHVDEVE